MDIELLKNFCTIARFKSTTKAAEYSNLSQSSVSRKLSYLEEELGGVLLFHRNSTGLTLTEEGFILLPYAEDILKRFHDLQGILRGPVDTCTGELRLYVHPMMSGPWFSSTIGGFARQNPDLNLKLSFENLQSFTLSSSHSGVYAGLTCTDPEVDSKSIWRQIGSFYDYPFASPHYIAELGSPETFTCLNRHKIIRFETSSQKNVESDKKLNCLQYLDCHPQKREPTISTNEITSMKSLVLGSVGIGMLPKHLLSPEEATQILQTAYDPKLHGIKRNIYLVYPTYLKNYTRIKLIKDHLIQTIACAPELFDIA